MKKKYYIIYKSFKDVYCLNQDDAIFTIVESKDVAEDWCKRNSDNYYYIERECE